MKAATIGYQKKVTAQNTGGEPINRPGTYNHLQRAASKLTSKSTWYKYSTKQSSTSNHSTKHSRAHAKYKSRESTQSANQPEAVLFIPHTPGGALKKEVQKVQESLCKGHKYQAIRIVERQGPKVGSLVANPPPWR